MTYLSKHVESSSLTTKNFISLLPQCLWSPNLVEWWLTLRTFPTLKLHYSLITWSCEVMWQTKNITTTVFMATKLGTMVHLHCKYVPQRRACLCVSTSTYNHRRLIRYHSFSTYGKFPEKLTYLTPDIHTYVCISGGKKP